MEIQFTTRIFKEGRTFIAHALELDVSSCGGTKEKALRNLKEAVRLFLEEAERLGTLERILDEALCTEADQSACSRMAVPNWMATEQAQDRWSATAPTDARGQ
jgi:predicted RNase H-like HicB family nuclease